jgi:hypothetical protein
MGCNNEQQHGIPMPQMLTELDINEVNTILKAEFPSARLYLSDKQYKTTSIEELRGYLRYDLTSKNKYVSEYYDCDDFSYSLMGELSSPSWGCLAFGILWTTTDSGNHAVNVFIDSDHTVWIVEPQTDGVFPLPEDWKPYLVMM